MGLNQFLASNTIVSAGSAFGQYLCCETIVDAPETLIALVSERQCYISEIRFWDRVLMSAGSSIGYGGPLDPRDHDYFFAETDLCQTFSKDASAEDYTTFIRETREKFPSHALYPAFDIQCIVPIEPGKPRKPKQNWFWRRIKRDQGGGGADNSF